MAQITVRMLGRFSAQVGDESIAGLGASKVQELFAYLLLHRDRPQSREVLAGLLWAETETWRAKKYLRQALWQLQAALRPLPTKGRRILRIDAEWIELNIIPEMALDVALIEQASSTLATLQRTLPLPPLQAERLRRAVAVYEDDLLPGWYQEWCAYERERLQTAYLALLDLLMADCEARGAADEGLRYAALSLRHDRARECTHRNIMRLQCLAGDRAAALRQFDRCVIAMDDELGVTPADETKALYEEIRHGRGPRHVTLLPQATGGSEAPRLGELLERLNHISRTLDDYRQQVQSSIEAVELALSGMKSGTVRRGRARAVA